MFKGIQVHLADIGLLLAYTLFRVLPVAWVSALGARRGRYRGQQLQELEARAQKNLAQIAPTADPTVVLPRLRAEAGRAVLEVLIADRLARSGHIVFEPCTALEIAAQQQRSIVFVSIHQSNVGDVTIAGMLSASGRFRHRYVVVRHIQNPVIRWLVHRTRCQSLRGRTGVVTSRVQGLARQMMRSLGDEAPSMVLMHVDEARAKQVWFPGFNAPVPEKGLNASYAIRLARGARACLVPIATIRDPACPTRFTLRAITCWDMATDERSDRAVLEDLNQLYQAQILQEPAQWLHLYHRRPIEHGAGTRD